MSTTAIPIALVGRHVVHGKAVAEALKPEWEGTHASFLLFTYLPLPLFLLIFFSKKIFKKGQEEVTPELRN
jgi:hypothetical protein